MKNPTSLLSKAGQWLAGLLPDLTTINNFIDGAMLAFMVCNVLYLISVILAEVHHG